jgi:hypothetical protein
MHLSPLYLSVLVAFAIASQVERSYLIPGVNIKNAAHVSAENVIPNSSIVVYKANVSADDRRMHEDDARNRLGEGPTSMFEIPGLYGYCVQTDTAGLANVAKSPLVSSPFHPTPQLESLYAVGFQIC